MQTPGRGLLFIALLTSPTLCAVVAAQELPAARQSGTGLSAQPLERIAPEMQKYIDDGRVAGMVMVARHGQIAYSRALGYANLEKRTPLRTDALFRTASTRKPLLAAATMVLVDDGRLRLDDPVSKYIPSFAHVRVFAGGTAARPVLAVPARPITIRHLLTHTSGLAGGYGDHPVNATFQREILDRPRRTLAAYCDALAAVPLEFSPGEQWQYSRSFEVVARVLEVVSGQPLELFLRGQFLNRLDAESVSIDVNEATAHRLPVQYEPGADGKLVVSRRRLQDGTGGVLVGTPSPDAPASPGTYRWAGSSGTFFWVDREADLVALIWTQSRARYSLEHHFQRLVYDALRPPQ